MGEAGWGSGTFFEAAAGLRTIVASHGRSCVSLAGYRGPSGIGASRIARELACERRAASAPPWTARADCPAEQTLNARDMGKGSPFRKARSPRLDHWPIYPLGRTYLPLLPAAER